MPPPAPQPTPQPAPSPTSAATDPTLRWAINEPTSLLPIHAVTPDDLLVIDALYDSLTRWDERLKPVPSVARRWERRDGGATWRFFLSSDARFSDGSRVTAQTFVRTWNALARRGRAHHHLRDVVGYRRVRNKTASRLAGVRARGTDVFEVRLSRQLAQFPSVVAHPALAPMRAAELRGQHADAPVGNGPFVMGEPWAHDRFVRLTYAGPVQSPDVHGVPVHEVVFTVGDPVSAYIAYEQGAVDVATVPPGGLAPDPATESPSTGISERNLLTGELPTVYLLAFNTARRPFDKIGVRGGVSLALDRRRLITDVFESNASPGRSAAPPFLFGDRSPRCQRCIYDPSRARRMLRESGLERLTLWINRGGDHELVAEGVRRDLLGAGLSVTVRAVSFARFQRALRRGRPGLYRFGWTADYPTLDNALRPLFHSDATPASGGANYGRYRDRDVDALLDRAAGEPRENTRLKLYRRVEEVVVGRDQAVVPVAILRRRTVVADRISNLNLGPMGTVNWRQVRIGQRPD